jgi:serine/threonine protein kinase
MIPLTLEHEHKIYENLKGGIGIPKMIHFGHAKELLHPYGNVLVMQLLGRTLDLLFEDCKNKFTLKTVLMLADQMIETIEFIHSKNYIHYDLNPRNIMMGIGNDKNRLFIGDYGISKKITNNNGKHITYRQV